MRKIYFFIVVLILTITTAYSQKEGDIVKLKTYCKVLDIKNIFEGENIINKKANNSTEVGVKSEKIIKTNFVAPNVKFIVNKIYKDTVAIVAINFNEKDKKNVEIYNDKIFYIDKTEFEKSAEIVENIDKFTVGILTLPFKARPQDGFSFDTEFNLNTTLNYNISNLYNARFNFQVGAGIGSVNLNESNANIEDLKAQDISALSMFSGLMIEYKRVQAGFYVGIDQINNQKQYQWQHNGNIWFGFGIGFNVFGISLGEKEKTQ